MKDTKCPYCMQDENPSLYQKFGYKLCDLKVSTLILFKEQSHKGRCIVAYKGHVSEITDLTDEELFAFEKDVQVASKAIHEAFNPTKVNYGSYSDTLYHLHVHLCPKYKDDEFEFGGVFAMNPNRVNPSEEELKAIGDQLLKHIKY